MNNHINLSCFYNKNHLICTSPIRFPCDSTRFACLKCMQTRVDYANTIECTICANNHRINFNLHNQQDETEYFNYLNETQNTTKNDLINYGEKLRANLTSQIENKEALNCIDALIEHIEYEIDVRVESLINEIQQIKFKLFSKIDEYKSCKTREVQRDEIEFDEILRQKANLSIQAYEKNCQKISHKTNSIEQSFKVVQKLNEKLKKSPNLGGHSMLGYLNSKYNHFNLKKLNKLKLNRTDFIELNVKSVCGLTDIFYFESFKKTFQLIISDFASNEIKYLNKFDSYLLKDFQLANLNRLNEMRFKNYYSICNNTDDDNHDLARQSIFLCDMELQRVLIFDLKLTKLKRIIQGKTDTKLEFECPRDICYYEHKIYVLDQGANSIDIFEENGAFVKSFYFNKTDANLIQSAWSVRVGANLIAIIDWMVRINFFDFDFNLIGTIEQANITSMCLINDSNLLFAHSDNGFFAGKFS